ncbi:MAG: 4-hydroxy-tetrahydrodipicolinate reductase [Bacteroidales bacterium]|nr:4-hydroxy-tetrahydrodipicolinate reductase [Bacteroidales bacterium]
MNIAIIGYGKMGKALKKTAEEQGHTITHIIDNKIDWKTKGDFLFDPDVAIEFSTPEAAHDNVMHCLEKGIPVVCGTTGWDEALQDVKQYVETNNKSFVYATNFSIGVNVLFALNKRLAAMMNDHACYRVQLSETHHTQKLDKPSGTAITLANDIIQKMQRYNNWKSNDNHVNSHEIPVVSYRESEVTGIHEIQYTSNIDEITLRHEAFSRQGFVQGALFVAKEIIGRKGFFTMQDLLF